MYIWGIIYMLLMVTSMLVTDVGDQMCWWQDLDVGDKSHHQHRELGTNIKYQSRTSYSGILWCLWPTEMSPTYFFCHQHLKWSPSLSHQQRLSPTSLSPTSLSPLWGTRTEKCHALNFTLTIGHLLEDFLDY